MRDVWQEFQASANADELAAASTPASILGGPGALGAAILALAYFPPLAAITQMRHAEIACALIAVGGVLTYIAWKDRCRGLRGTLATLLDNAFYSAALALAAASSTEATGIALAVVHGLMVVAFPARNYAISRLLAVVMIVPVLLIILLVRPHLPVGLVLLANLVIFFVVSQHTRAQRADRLRQMRLEQALGAANQLADESVQAALTTTLLTLGHFLHELRNYQTAIAANLEYVEAAGELNPSIEEALQEAREAQQGQAELLRRTIEDLRSRSSKGEGVFHLRETLHEIAETEHEVRLTIVGDEEFEMRGRVEHLRIVLLNLNRNAAQAGARDVEVHVRGEASGTSVRLTVMDDGSGVAEAKRARLFDSFALSDKPGGSGLGLYLIRRYVELLGGNIEAGDISPLGGATFVIRLPARALTS